MNDDITPNGNVSTDIVREQEGWLRELVRHLVGASEVEDIVQDTWIEAMKTPVYLNGSLRGWLRTVATRLAMRTHRSRNRRSRRERIAAADHATSAADHGVLWAEVQERLTTAVGGLPEPYRETIRLRYFAGMTAREIANHTGTPIATVRIRLQRGVLRLREDMSRRCGPDWRPALALFALPSREVLADHAVRRTPWLIMAAAGCVLAIVGAVVSNTEDEVATEFTAAREATPRAKVELAAPAGGDRLAREHLPVRRHTTPTRRVIGRVLDTAGRPIQHAQIWFRRLLGSAYQRRANRHEDHRPAKIEFQRLGTADRHGRFDLDCPYGVGTLSARGLSAITPGPGGLEDIGRLVSLCLWPIAEETERVADARIVASHSVCLRGTVVDADGKGLPDVRILARCEQLPNFPEILDRQLFVDPVDSTVTDQYGRFEFATYPTGCPTQIHLSKPGYRQLCLAPDTSNRRLRIPLSPAASRDPMRIAGRVFDLHGRAICAAIVGIARARTQTDSTGDYRLELAEIDLNAILYAGKKGYRTAVERDIAKRLLRRRGGTLFVDLTLGPRPRSISGVLTDGRGIPLPGHLVFLADPFCLDGGSITAEALAAGQVQNEFGASDVAGADGGFKIDGLSDRFYGIRVYDGDMANATDAGSIAAGSRDVEVRIHDRRFVTMAGRLRDDDGLPVVGAKVYFGTAIRKKPNAIAKLRAPVRTDKNGGFTLKKLPRAGGTVFVVGGSAGSAIDAGIVPTYVELDPSSLRQTELDLVVARLCHFRVDAPEAPSQSTIHFLDDYGERLDIFVLDAAGCRRHESWTIEDSSTQILCASQRAKTMVLSDPDGMEITRLRIHLSPEFLTEIGF
jgi:RNA polymerase sigma factor (sigma-70 family)